MVWPAMITRQKLHQPANFTLCREKLLMIQHLSKQESAPMDMKYRRNIKKVYRSEGGIPHLEFALYSVRRGRKRHERSG